MESCRKEAKGVAEASRKLPERLVDWVKFGLGLLAVLALALVLSEGCTPPGAAGTVLRHNQRFDLDATGLFYTEVEGLEEFE